MLNSYYWNNLYIFAGRNVKRYDYGSNDNNDRPEEADFENGKVGKGSQVVHRSA